MRTRLLAILLGCTLGAQAQMLGRLARLEYYAPNLNTLYTGPSGGFQPQQFTVSNGVEVTYFGEPNNVNFSLDISATRLSFTTNDIACCPSPSTFNGPVVTLLNGNASITGVTIVTNEIGLPANRVSFTSNQVRIDWQQVNLTGNKKLELEVTFTQPSCYRLGDYGHEFYSGGNGLYGTDFVFQVGGTGGSCPWSIAFDQSWLRVIGATSGTTGSGFLNFTMQVDPITGNQPRASVATVTLDGYPYTFDFVQNSSNCTFSGIPSALNFTAAGGQSNLNLTSVPSGCWVHAAVNAGNQAPWLSANAVVFRTPFTLNITAAPNTSTARSYDAYFSGQATSPDPFIHITQVGSITPPSISCQSNAGPNTVGISYSNTCTVSGGSSPFTWSIISGSLPAGLTLTPSTGTALATISGTPTTTGSYAYALRVLDSLSQAATKSFTGTIDPPLSISVTPPSASLRATQSQQFNATVTGFSNTNVTWTISPQTGSISANGLYTAPAFVGATASVTVTAISVADPSRSASATVTLQPAVTVTVTPPTVTLTQGQSQLFTANGSVTWSISPALGAISQNGLYTAPTTTTSEPQITVRATSTVDTSVSATATIQLRNLTCSPSASPLSASFDTAGGTGTIAVTLAAGCPWTATSAEGWVNVTAGASGNGVGTVNYSVAANTGGLARSTLLTVAGIAVTVSQAGRGCAPSLTPASRYLPAGSTSDNLTLTLSSPDCPWTAVSNVSWARVSRVSGPGSATIPYTVDANPAPTSRAGTMTIAGQTFTIVQAGSDCSAISLSEASQSFAAEGGPGLVQVNASAGCTYSAVSNSPFLTISGNAARSGPIALSYTVGPNNRPENRSGSLTIAGKTLLVNQLGSAPVAISCVVANIANPAPLRSTGQTELLSDLDLTCTGRSGGLTIQADILIALNAAVTNRLNSNDETDATLTIAGGGVIKGRLEGANALRFSAVPIATGEGTVNRALRISKLRAAAAANVTANVLINAPVPIPVTQAFQPVGVSRPALAFSRGGIRDGSGTGQKVIPLVFQEGFPTAFRTKEGEAGGASTDTGTRLLLRIRNVPVNAQVYAPAASTNNRARLISANPSGIGGFTVDGSPRGNGNYQPIVLSAGSGYAVWEMTTVDNNAIDGPEFPLLIENASASDIEQITLEALLAPLSDVATASATAVIPRFADPSAAPKLLDLRISSAIQIGNSPIGLRTPVALGSTASFTYRIANDSDQAASGVVFRSTLGEGLTNATCTPAVLCQVEGRFIRYAIGGLTAGQQVNVGVTASVGGAASCPNCIGNGSALQSTAGVSGAEADPNPSNNFAETQVEVETACRLTLSRSQLTVSGVGASLLIDVTTGPSCDWNQPASDGGIVVSPSGSLRGSASLTVMVPPNPTAAQRTLTVGVAGQTLTITQAGQGCTFSLNGPQTIPQTGGPFAIQVQTTCAWQAFGGPDWLRLGSPTAGSGPGTVTFTAQPNASITPRTGFIEVGGQTFRVTQDPVGGAGSITQPPPGALRFVAMEPCRLMETRAEYNFQGRTGAFGPPYLRAGEIRTLAMASSNVCRIPANAQVYVLNVTVVPRGSVDFVTLWPAGEVRPNVWTVRSPDSQIVANSTFVKAGSGAIQVYASNDTDLIIDISGYLTDDSQANQVFYSMTPCRVTDTRADYRSPAGPFGPPSMNARETRPFRFPATPYCTVPQGASAYSVSLTVVPPGPLQYLTAWPAGGAQPNVSNINSPNGRVLANNVIIPASPDGSINLFTFDRSDVIIDINGYFAPDDGANGLFYFPLTQCRVSDTLLGNEATRTIPLVGSACPGIPAAAKAYTVTATAIPDGSPMPFLTIYPTGTTRPNASILNAFQGQTVTNSAIVPAGLNGALDIFTYRQTRVVLEISGYFGR